MLLSLPDDSQPVKDMFERFFAAESTPARVRAAEPVGFDPKLWKELVALDAPFMRLSEEAGGGGMSVSNKRQTIVVLVTPEVTVESYSVPVLPQNEADALTPTVKAEFE